VKPLKLLQKMVILLRLVSNIIFNTLLGLAFPFSFGSYDSFLSLVLICVVEFGEKIVACMRPTLSFESRVFFSVKWPLCTMHYCYSFHFIVYSGTDNPLHVMLNYHVDSW
jgi:hypothetical protein